MDNINYEYDIRYTGSQHILIRRSGPSDTWKDFAEFVFTSKEDAKFIADKLNS